VACARDLKKGNDLQIESLQVIYFHLSWGVVPTFQSHLPTQTAKFKLRNWTSHSGRGSRLQHHSRWWTWFAMHNLNSCKLRLNPLLFSVSRFVLWGSHFEFLPRELWVRSEQVQWGLRCAEWMTLLFVPDCGHMLSRVAFRRLPPALPTESPNHVDKASFLSRNLHPLSLTV